MNNVERPLGWPKNSYPAFEFGSAAVTLINIPLLPVLFCERVRQNIADNHINGKETNMLKTFVLLQGFLVLTALSAENDYGQSGPKSVPASEVNGTFRMGFTGK